MTAGTRIIRITLASINTAAAMPIASILTVGSGSSTKLVNTTIMIAARTVWPLNSARFPVVQPGETVSTTWQVNIPLSAASGTYHLVGRAAYQRSPGATQPIFETGGLTRATLGPAFDAALDPEFIGLNTGDS
jgi:NPCBM-associated, NEW3 domain of alpha-galactosidase